MPRDPRDIGLRKPERESRRLAEAAEDARLGSYPRGGSSGEAGPEGPAGEKGAEGKEGPPGEAGAPGETDIVYHGTNASEPRPEVEGPVIWIGTAKPENSLEHDLWFNTTPSVAGGTVDWGVVEALPGEAVEGDRCTFKAATGIYWRLIYTGEETYPWAKIGGPPLLAEKEAGVTGGAKTEYTTLACEVKTPLKGDYLVTIGGSVATSAAGTSGLLSYSVGATAAADADACGYAAGWVAYQSRTKKKAAVATATALLMKYRVTGGSGNFNDLFIAIDPQRVG